MRSKPVALITGASRGIGRAIAVALSEAGYRPALAARNEESLKVSAGLCNRAEAVAGAETEAEALIFPIDLTDDGAPEQLVESVIKAAGRIDLLVNNAGTVLSRSFEETGADDWDRLMALNARAPFLLTQAALPALRRAPEAAVVNIGSVVSFKGYEKQAAYTASKHALAGWTKVLWLGKHRPKASGSTSLHRGEWLRIWRGTSGRISMNQDSFCLKKSPGLSFFS